MSKEDIVNSDYTKIEARVIAAIEKGEIYDPHADRASMEFNINIDEVTEDQREIGKCLNLLDIYSGTTMAKLNVKGSVTGRFNKDNMPDIHTIKPKDTEH